MSNFVLGSLGYRALDNDGAIMPGALLYVFEEDGVTPLTVYSDADLSDAHTNPVEADGNGWFDPIYGTDGVLHVFELRTSEDVLVKTWEDVLTVQLSTSSINTRLLRVAATPYDFDGVGTGLVDDRAAVQAAIDYVSAQGGGTVNLAGGTWKCDATVTWPSDVKILGPGTLVFTAAASEEYLKAQGTLGTAFAFDGNAAYRASAVVTEETATAIAAGDMVTVRSSQVFVSAVTSGEVNTVRSVASATHNLTHPLLDDYNDADTAVLQKITPVENIEMENVDIIASALASGSTPSVIYLERCRNVRIRNVRVNGVKSYGYRVRQSLDVHVEGGSVVSTGVGNGVFLGDATRDTVFSGTKFENLDRMLLTQVSSAEIGGPHDFKFHHCHARYIDTDLHTILAHCTGASIKHGQNHMCPGVSFRCTDGVMEKNYFADDGAISVVLPSGFPSRAAARRWTVRVYDNDFDGEVSMSSSDSTFTGSGGTVSALRVEKNRAEHGFACAVTWDGTTIVANKLAIQNNVGPGDIAVTISGADAEVKRLSIIGNDGGSVTSIGSIVVTDGGVGVINRIKCERNELHSDVAAPFKITATDAEIWVEKNIVEGDSATCVNGIHIDGGVAVHVRENYVRGLTTGGWAILVEDLDASAVVECDNNDVVGASSGIFLDCDAAIARGSLSGNKVDAQAGTALKIDCATGATGMVVVGNTVVAPNTAGRHCLHVTGFLDGLSIAGNRFRHGSSDDDANIHLDATASGDITNVSLSGNTLIQGSVGVKFTNGDGKCWWSGGVMDSVTAKFEGAIGRRVLHSDSDAASVGSISTGVVLSTFTTPANMLKVGDSLRFHIADLAENLTGSSTAATMAAQLRKDTSAISGLAGTSIAEGDQMTTSQDVTITIVSSTVYTISGTGHGNSSTGTNGGSGTSDQNFINAGPGASIDLTAAIVWDVFGTSSQNHANINHQLSSFTCELLREGT